MRSQYPGVPVVTHVNTVAAGQGADRRLLHLRQRARHRRRVARRPVIMLPDQFLARNTRARRRKKKVITWAGACEVHETFTAGGHRRTASGLYPMARSWPTPKTRPVVADAADFSGLDRRDDQVRSRPSARPRCLWSPSARCPTTSPRTCPESISCAAATSARTGSASPSRKSCGLSTP